MRFLKTTLIILILSILAVPLLSCGADSEEDELPEYQEVTVQRGDITIDITAAGNLALSRTEDLAIDLFYQEGTLAEVLVEEGDTVEEGQVLVRLDTDEWESELGDLEDQVIAEERDLVQAQINLDTAEQNLKTSRDNEADKELAVLNKQISLDQANYNLSVAEETHTWPDLEIAESDVEKAEAFLEYALDGLSEYGTSDWNRVVTRARAELTAAEAVYDALIEGYDTEEVAIKKKQVEAAELELAAAQEDLADVVEDVALKELLVTLNEGKVTDAEKALADAKEELEDAQSKSSEVTAPFAGFITSVNVEGGDEVMKGTVAVQLADPNKFEADILVSEMDILQVKLGGEAWVAVDAMSGMSLPAKVTHIAPTATIQSGVVNYEVKVEVQSMEAVMQERQEAMQQAMADIAAGEIPPPLQQAIEEGRITREQVEEMLEQGPPEGFTPPAGMEGASGQAQAALTVPEDFQLREGLTVTVTIIADERNDVLLVPNAAVTTEGEQSYVQVKWPNGATEQRAVQTGLTNWQFTEITEGLEEGEQVLVPQGTATTTTTSQQGPQGTRLFIPGPPPR